MNVDTGPGPLGKRFNNATERAFRELSHARAGSSRRRPDPVPVELEGVRWVCVRVMPNREFLVADYLGAVGFRTFAPHGVKVYQRARVSGSEQRRRAERDYAVFGSYVFVGEPARLYVGKHSHWYIAGVIENAGGRYLPTAFISMASRAWTEGRWDGRVDLRERYLGKPVKVVSGPFEGWDAVVEKLPSELKAVVTVRMFGSLRSVTVDIDTLEVV